ncbi:MAG TPA: DUF4202 domain-containing protein [Acidimicrobiales bacterium]
MERSTDIGQEDRLAAALAAIDEVNADDPFTLVFEGREHPKELLHAELMTNWVRRLDPDATDEQIIAARAHHLRRWSVPRAAYPDGRAGYLRWRAALKRQHAEEVGAILTEAGYGPAAVQRVQQIIRKEGLGHDRQVQVHEDALCLVFLQTQFDEVAERLGDERTVEVLRKTIRKMSPEALALAAGLPLGRHARELLTTALAPNA